MAYLGILDRSMTIHHLICMGGLSGGLVTGYSADILIGAIFLTEISNPAMHIRVILRLLGLRYTKAYETSEITYMGKYLLGNSLVLYMFGRVFLGLPVLYRTWMCPSNHIIVKLMGTGLIAQSLKFIYQMVFILKARANEYAERKAKNIRMRWLDPLTKEELAKIESYNKKNNKKQHVP